MPVYKVSNDETFAKFAIKGVIIGAVVLFAVVAVAVISDSKKFHNIGQYCTPNNTECAYKDTYDRKANVCDYYRDFGSWTVKKAKLVPGTCTVSQGGYE